MSSNAQIARDFKSHNPYDPLYDVSLQYGSGILKDVGKIANKVAKETKIGSTLGRSLLPAAVGAVSAVNPMAGLALNELGRKGLKEAEKRGYGILTDAKKAAKASAKDTKIASTLAKNILPGAVDAISRINPTAGAVVNKLAKDGIKQIEKKGYGAFGMKNYAVKGMPKKSGSGKKKRGKGKK